MKKVPYIIIALLLSVFSIQAQNTDGKEFWVTYGQNSAYSYSTIDLQIRIVSGDKPTTGTIYFTNIDVSVYFNIGAREVFTYVLSEEEKQAVYNTTTGITNYSVHITGSEPVSVYALNQHEASTDATNVLPVTALSTAYYHISYTTTFADAYAVIATEDNTKVYHNHAPVATIDKGYVYYKGSSPDMTGDYISSDKPIALFALTRSFGIFSNSGSDHLFQQMSPVNTWGKEFFAPVSHPVHDVVRIVASQDGTDITQTGGIIRTVPGAQTTLTNLQAGQFVELETPFSNDGCSIHATKPVGVCTYYGGGSPYGDAAPTWLPPIEQSVTTALIAPFISSGMTLINAHYATLFTPTAAKESLKVSIGGNPPEPLSGGSWIDNTTAEMSFYKMPLTNDDAAYYFTSPAGFVILCYGWGSSESYYYLAYSAMRDLQAAFYANDIHYQDLEEQPFCENLVEFRAETENMGVEVVSLEWYIDGVEYLPAHNQQTWSKTFAIGEYEIEMRVYFENDETLSKTGILKIISCGTAAEFYANDVHHSTLKDTIFCSKNVDFRAEIEGLSPDPGSLKWFIDGVEETAAQDQLQWSKEFETGVYEIKMEVVYANNTTATITGTLKVEVFWIKMKNIMH